MNSITSALQHWLPASQALSNASIPNAARDASVSPASLGFASLGTEDPVASRKECAAPSNRAASAARPVPR